MTKEEYDKNQMKRQAKALVKLKGIKYTEALREVKASYISDYK